MRDLVRLILVILLSGASLAAGAGDDLPFSGAAGTLPPPPQVVSGRKFLPVEQAYPLLVESRGQEVLVSWNITPGYYLYRERMKFALRRDGKSEALAVELPAGEQHEDAYLGKTVIYRGLLEVSVPFASAEAAVLEIKSQGCADAGLCYPPRTQWFEIDPAAMSVSEIAVTPARPASASATARAPPGGATVLYMLLLAALGGLILNLMPCVFPVLSLKALSFGTNGGHNNAAHGLLYTAGVVLSFLAVAAVLLLLRGAGEAIGWGFHLQSPVFIGALAYLFFTMGLALSGLLELGSGWMGLGSTLAARPGYTGTFFTGVLAAVVASPCTAPFMATALGFALAQPPAVALLIFAALGFGMASPFLLLELSPGLRRHLPRPGPWMEGFRQLLAFPLYATAVWLLWVLGRQSGVDGMALITLGCVTLALASWTWHRARSHRRPAITRSLALLLCALALGMLRSPLLDSARPELHAARGDGNSYSAERLAALREAGKPVFINVTADWCITCIANESIALSSAEVQQAFAREGVVYLEADWTSTDPRITALLEQHHRDGVPLYLFYAASATAPVVLPQLLTPGIVVAAISGAN